MTTGLMDQLSREHHNAEAEMRKATHWLMTFETFDRLRLETRDMAMVPSDGTKQPELFGLPIYQTHRLEEPGFLLRDGRPYDEVRKAELRRRFAEIDREYRRLTALLIKELSEIEARKPPRPMFIDAAGATEPPSTPSGHRTSSK